MVMETAIQAFEIDAQASDMISKVIGEWVAVGELPFRHPKMPKVLFDIARRSYDPRVVVWLADGDPQDGQYVDDQESFYAYLREMAQLEFEWEKENGFPAVPEPRAFVFSHGDLIMKYLTIGIDMLYAPRPNGAPTDVIKEIIPEPKVNKIFSALSRQWVLVAEDHDPRDVLRVPADNLIMLGSGSYALIRRRSSFVSLVLSLSDKRLPAFIITTSDPIGCEFMEAVADYSVYKSEWAKWRDREFTEADFNAFLKQLKGLDS